MGRGGGGGGGFSGGGGGSFGGGGGHIGGGSFGGGHVGGSSHSGGSSWGGSSHSSGGSSWGGSSHSYSGGHSYGGGYRSYGYRSGGNGLFPPLWWWIWGNNSGRNNNNNNNNNNGNKGPEKNPQPKKPEKKTTAVGCLSVILIIVAIILAVIMINGINASKDAKNRTKLDVKPTVNIGYIDDQLGWLDKKSTVESAMKVFYDKTGVMPYLIITSNIGGATNETQAQAWGWAKYEELFKNDGTHLLVVWYQVAGTQDDYAWMFAGTPANGVIDEDAIDDIYSYFNRYYTSDYDDNQYFAKVFEESAEKIMKQSDTGWKSSLFWLIAVIAVLIIMNVIDYKNVMKIKKQEAAAELLNANIEDPGWKDEAENLSEKYEDEASELASKYDNK
ncbi:MAG: hypothetical protein IKI73_06665 [Firmicutes bacterium]|nr:hypothetical protein [Bacillota bacterium]